MTEPWELTATERERHREDRGIVCLDCDAVISMVDEWDIDALLTAAVKKYQEWLAKQCGPKPCEGCDTPLYIYNDLYDKEDCQRNCPKYQVFQAQQAGLAKGLAEAESRVKAREREIVEWATDEANRCGCAECAMWVERLESYLESWLRKE